MDATEHEWIAVALAHLEAIESSRGRGSGRRARDLATRALDMLCLLAHRPAAVRECECGRQRPRMEGA